MKKSGSRNDNSILFIIKTIILNNRLKTYRKYIELAKDLNYRVCSMRTFYEERNQKDVKHFVLRHDVDNLGPEARKMYEIEKMSNVKSTYYFRFSTIDLVLIKEMINNGFEVGFHYETLSDYAKKNNITNISEININLVREILKNEIKTFNNIIGFNTISCAAHGDPKNISLNYSNNNLLENQNMEDYGLLFEAYDQNLYEQYIDCHIMDSNIRTNYGFAYKDNPIEELLSGKRNIIFLAHPNHWFFSLRNRIINLINLFRGKVKLSTERQFRRISNLNT